ncbi:MAG: class I adenylate-forming enzyme family protein [Xanthobacteraceae bacterium]|nr:class I adenylate-forming enzyme family protein [Xanthobacteraceae bacterium]
MNDWFEHILFATRAQPETSAIVMEDRVVTYGMLGDAITTCAHRILALDFPRDGLVAVCITNPIRHLAVSLALFRIGVRAVSIDAAHRGTPGLGYNLVLGDAAAKPVFARAGAFAEATDDWFAPDAANAGGSLPTAFAGDRTVCRHSLTSGSTGAPKLLDHTVGALGRSINSTVGYSNCGLVLCLPGLTSVFGFRIACGVLASRKTLLFSDSPFQSLRMVELFGIDFVYAATEQLVSLVRVARGSGARLQSLRRIAVAGGIPTRALLESAAVHLCKDVICRYGTSELGVLAEAPAARVLERPGLTGDVLPGFEIAAFDPSGRPCAPGETGIVKARVKPTPDRADDPWTDHGDIGWVGGDGEVFVVGRTADIAAADFAGAATRQVSPVYEIEHLVRLEWDAADAAAILVEPRTAGAAPEIWVGTVACQDARLDRLEDILRRHGIAGVVRLFALPAIPRGAAGKIQRAQLKALMLATAGAA